MKRRDMRYKKVDVRLSTVGVSIIGNEIILSGMDKTQLQQTICF